MEPKMQSGSFRRLPHASVGALLSFSLLLLSPTADAQSKAHFAAPKVASAATSSSTSPYCPPYSGILNSISVPVGGTTTLYIELGGTLPYDVTFTLSSGNSAYVVFGDEATGFGPTVTIPAGTLDSPPFTIQGVSAGPTYILAASPQLGDIEDPVASWNVTNASGTVTPVQLLDANNLTTATDSYPSCVSAAGIVSTDPTTLADCGIPIKGVAADGVSPVLLRTVAGLKGTACFTLTTTGSLAYGNVATPSMEATGVQGLFYAFSMYTPPDGYGDPSDSRTLNIQFDFFLDGGLTNTSTINVTTTLVRPPLVLIHGVWSKSSIWNAAFVREGTAGWFSGAPKAAWYTTNPANYSGTAGRPFTTNEVLLSSCCLTGQPPQGFIPEALTQIRGKGYAAAQADVIGHSMGGNLTRLYSTLTSGPSAYKRPDNLNLGDVHRLITLDTPHFGSNFPNLIIALNQSTPGPTAPTVNSITGGDITQGAVCDLAQNSKGLTALNSPTNLTGQFITGTGGPAGSATVPALWWGGVFGFVDSFEAALTAKVCDDPDDPDCGINYLFPQTTVNAFRFRELNDSIVPISSQQGKSAGTSINFSHALHQHIPNIPGVQRGIMDDPAVATEAFAILDGPITGLINPLPAVGSLGTGVSISPTPGLGPTVDAANYKDQCSPGGPLYPAAPSTRPAAEGSIAQRSALAQLVPSVTRQTTPASAITVTSPAAGARLSSGSTLSITVSVAAGITVNGYGVTISGIGVFPGSGLTVGAGGSAFQASTVLTGISVGPLTIQPYIYDGTNTFVLGTPITVVENYSGGTLTSVNLTSHNFLTLSPGATQVLFLMGTYSDGSGPFDISSSLLGTIWSSSNPSVLTVDPNGNVTVVATGIAVVTARNGGFTDFASFVVENPASPLAPIDYTSQFTIQESGIRLNRNTGFYVQTVTLTNTSSIPLAGPVYLVVSGLPSGVSLIGINGVTANIPPVGSDYFTLPLAGYSLAVAPGQVVSLQFQFLDPSQKALSYSLKVMRTSVAP
jgi:pimeloyl-ACP methyl ester carboxylesterase